MTTPQDPFSADAAAAAQFLGGGRTVAAKFPKNGHKVEGTVTAFRMAQRTHIDSGDLLFWEGKKPTEQAKLKYPATAQPCMQLIVDLQCEPAGITWETNRYIEKALPEDDGMRALYVTGDLQRAVGKALQDAGHKAPEIGGYLEVVKTEEKRIEGTSFTRYVYAARYTPAAQNEKATEAYFATGGDGTPPDPFAP